MRETVEYDLAVLLNLGPETTPPPTVYFMSATLELPGWCDACGDDMVHQVAMRE
jgi:hypothetical protein